jgi:tetratricopeptide (TPR) repeat protein
VVLDNAEDEGLMQEWLPKLGKASVLVTARRGEWAEYLGIEAQALGTLPRKESRRLLRKLAKRLEKAADEEVDGLAERMGDLPLALDLAGRYLKDRRRLTIEGYLRALEKAGSALRHSSLLDWTEHSPTQHETSLAASFELSWERIKNEEARSLFCGCGYCAANIPIGWEILYGMMNGQEEAAQESVDRAMKELGELGLVKLEEQGAGLHLLLGEFARAKDGERENSELPRLSEALAKLATAANESGLPERFKALREHVQTVAAAAEERNLESSGWLWNELGYYLHQVAEYGKAKTAYGRALRIYEAALGKEHLEVATITNNLGLVLQELGVLKGAQAAYERALTIYKKYFPENHRSIQITEENLAGVKAEIKKKGKGLSGG